jgi:hypothetical protein
MMMMDEEVDHLLALLELLELLDVRHKESA